FPSGLKWAEAMLVPSVNDIDWPVCRSQITAIFGFETVTMCLPSELNCADLAWVSCCKGLVTGFPVSASQIRAAPSLEIVTNRLPSGLNCATKTSPAFFKTTAGSIQV